MSSTIPLTRSFARRWRVNRVVVQRRGVTHAQDDKDCGQKEGIVRSSTARLYTRPRVQSCQSPIDVGISFTPRRSQEFQLLQIATAGDRFTLSTDLLLPQPVLPSTARGTTCAMLARKQARRRQYASHCRPRLRAKQAEQHGLPASLLLGHRVDVVKGVAGTRRVRLVT